MPSDEYSLMRIDLHTFIHCLGGWPANCDLRSPRSSTGEPMLIANTSGSSPITATTRSACTGDAQPHSTAKTASAISPRASSDNSLSASNRTATGNGTEPGGSRETRARSTADESIPTRQTPKLDGSYWRVGQSAASSSPSSDKRSLRRLEGIELACDAMAARRTARWAAGQSSPKSRYCTSTMSSGGNSAVGASPSTRTYRRCAASGVEESRTEMTFHVPIFRAAVGVVETTPPTRSAALVANCCPPMACCTEC